MKKLKILFACGGTAGHINPALSVAATIRQRYPDTEICFAGNPNGMEARLVPAAGFDFVPFRAMGIQRRLTPQNIVRNFKSVGLLITSGGRAQRVIEAYKPDIVVGTGGYVSGPIVLKASQMGIKTVTHEQNAFPGVTTKLLFRHVDKVLLAVEKAKDYLPQGIDCVVTGNPIRPQILTADRYAARKVLGIPSNKICLLSFGGSLGAQRINESIADVMAWHVPKGNIHHIHATGQYGVELLPHLLKERGVDVKSPSLDIREYINDMPMCLAAADLVICRAGAITLSELQAVGRASILIPSPNVAENHQFHNAMVLVNQNAAVVIEEKELSGKKLASTVNDLILDPQRLRLLGENAKKLAILNANDRILEEIMALCLS